MFSLLGLFPLCTKQFSLHMYTSTAVTHSDVSSHSESSIYLNRQSVFRRSLSSSIAIDNVPIPDVYFSYSNCSTPTIENDIQQDCCIMTTVPLCHPDMVHTQAPHSVPYLPYKQKNNSVERHEKERDKYFMLPLLTFVLSIIFPPIGCLGFLLCLKSQKESPRWVFNLSIF